MIRSTKARPRYARLASNLADHHACYAPLGLIDGSGHLGQYQIGRLPWQFALAAPRGGPVSSNRILSGLSRAELSLLQPHLQPVDLPWPFLMRWTAPHKASRCR